MLGSWENRSRELFCTAGYCKEYATKCLEIELRRVLYSWGSGVLSNLWLLSDSSRCQMLTLGFGFHSEWKGKEGCKEMMKSSLLLLGSEFHLK